LSNKKIIVDAGSFLSKDRIISGLAKENLTPSDINIVILTHLHLDHTINVYLFDKAKIFAKFILTYCGQYHIPAEGCMQKTNLSENTVIDNDVKVIITPGHTEDGISIVVDTPEGKVVIAGDAVPGKEYVNLDKQPMESAIWNMDEFNKSRKKILEIADYIIPGHGPMFKVKK
jgi:glyoxylase-like metal-dependent hydrolase (beta-lactamase superfamily II)